ncbi:30S ribosomal protein S7 [Dehalococcoides mccartyi]|uniref:Small ribosomal subunit protein uS7 n=1 Tax=Dehalococcoides mccartyi (strain ATCC BAA-2266 / KCTC 15142 / 195) TaxID=243164 RepID=RS7_DEHM1|nr:30S ribosomal protein S7 [Dehalococcoides mccartyi]Q3Z984.1 RecName: Full=Small ribosomal subunit protein uS7; AltName: Full=30S ribosomal protein S7 [Dehalococcoides mccartyi 195]AAW40194.1 ribosomal protein S7 [Dehalococcoides mccartyi 195]
MPRRARKFKRAVAPDSRYNSLMLSNFINKLMMHGQKATAQRIVYDAIDIMGKQENKEGLAVFEQGLKNATPFIEVKPRRVGGATYQVPIEVRPDRAQTMAMRWIIKAARKRTGKSMAERLAAEMLEASREQGAAVKKREETHKMAEANRAFVHYRW